MSPSTDGPPFWLWLAAVGLSHCGRSSRVTIRAGSGSPRCCARPMFWPWSSVGVFIGQVARWPDHMGAQECATRTPTCTAAGPFRVPQAFIRTNVSGRVSRRTKGFAHAQTIKPSGASLRFGGAFRRRARCCKLRQPKDASGIRITQRSRVFDGDRWRIAARRRRRHVAGIRIARGRWRRGDHLRRRGLHAHRRTVLRDDRERLRRSVELSVMHGGLDLPNRALRRRRDLQADRLLRGNDAVLRQGRGRLWPLARVRYVPVGRNVHRRRLRGRQLHPLDVWERWRGLLRNDR
jgi:hypothetical protein